MKTTMKTMSALRFGAAVSVGLAVAACASQPLPMASVPVAKPAPAPAAPVAIAPAAPATATMTPPPPTTPDAPFRAQAPAPGPEPVFQVPAFKRFKLKSGVEVILAEFHDLPLVELHLVVKTGGAANPVGEAGLADLTANLLDEGTATRSALQIAE